MHVGITHMDTRSPNMYVLFGGTLYFFLFFLCEYTSRNNISATFWLSLRYCGPTEYISARALPFTQRPYTGPLSACSNLPVMHLHLQYVSDILILNHYEQ